MAGVWTIEIGGTATKYKEIDFERRLEKNKPTTFSATVEYSSDIDYFDLIEIKRDGTTEWKGFVEDYDLKWEKEGLFLFIQGRANSLILWKKWSENFSNLHDDTKGFFGLVSATELIKFILRNPTSDIPKDYPLNKEGWGMDRTRIGECTATRTSVGDPNWVKLRRRGYGWRNKGTQFNSEAPDVDANISHEWDDSGAGDNPWIEDLDDTTYIYSNTIDQEDVFSFENLSTLDPNASSINRCDIAVRWKPKQSWWWWEISRVEIWISPDGGTNYYYVGTFGGHQGPLVSNPFKTYTFNASNIITTVSEADNARVKFINKANHNVFISWCYLAINYSSNGDQETDDYFDISFDYDEIMGIYIESRFDNDSYPRNYRIYKVSNDAQDYDTDYTEVDPNTHITLSDTNIGFNAFLNEDAYVYKDFGADYFGDFFKHTVEMTVNTNPVPAPPSGGEIDGIIFSFWCLANDLDDVRGLQSGSKDNLSLSVWRDPAGVIAGGAPVIRLNDQDGAVGNITYSPEIDETKTYSCEIVRNEGSITVSITEDGTPFATLSLTMTDSSNKFRYLYACSTANQGRAQNCDVDINDLTLEIETALISEVTNNTFRDIIHSWDPQEMSQIRIRITAQESGKAWAISQIYIYPSVDMALRTFRDTEQTTLLTDDASSGQADIDITSASGFNAGDIVTIKDDDNQEVNQISSVAGLTITMVNNLEYDYTTANNAFLLKGFPSEQYIHAFSFDTEYSTPIGPLNLPRARLIDQINTIMKKCQESYIPYEWWLAMDSNNTFHMDSQKGTDISGSVSFIKGINLGGNKKIGEIEDTIQRLKLLGQGEGKRQEDVGSEWVEDKSNMVNINSFIEEVVSDKSVVDNDVAEVIANVELLNNAPPNTQITLDVTNDTYNSMDYDVGDTVTVVDSLLNINGTYKIYNINKKITKDGESITIVVNAPFHDEEDEWHEIYKRIKMIEINEATAADWSGEANNEGKVDAEKVTTFFEKEAKNDSIEESKGVRDPKWYYVPVPPDGYTGPVDHFVGAGTAIPEYYDWNVALNGMTFHHTDKKMMMKGPTGGVGSNTLMVEMRGESGDEIDIPISKNPKLVAELKFVKDSGGPTDWVQGDIFEIGLYGIDASIGYFIRFTKDAGNTLTAEAVWNEDGSNEETQSLGTVNMSDINLSENYRYRIEIIIDYDEAIAFFHIFDLSVDNAKYPLFSVIKMRIDTSNTLRPLYMGMTADNNGGGGANLAQVYIYHFKSEWEKL